MKPISIDHFDHFSYFSRFSGAPTGGGGRQKGGLFGQKWEFFAVFDVFAQIKLVYMKKWQYKPQMNLYE